ncbi:unnamed protein product [Effrenium voratum]|uniref:Acyltransferase 3 domain-containing protein n=2 Tax=Effrenium voratum TaxID=2562239 RepID=A0AA36IRD9_9DINO|nr:unnamed protein product [Effrenium voratum]CAJ1438843.1 unnamed protein product [Effrenium voratum]
MPYAIRRLTFFSLSLVIGGASEECGKNATSAALLQHSTKRTQIEVQPKASCNMVPYYACAVATGIYAVSLFSLHRWSAAESAPKQSGARDPHVDNAKFLGMVLVCWSHIGRWKVLEYSGLTSEFVIWFHMPMYVFLSGSFVRPASWQTFLKILVLILFPLVAFCLLIFPLERVMLDMELKHLWLPGAAPYFEGSVFHLLMGSGPGWFIWFLRCLLIWKLASMFTVSLPKAAQIALGILSGLAGVYCHPEGNTWSYGLFAYQRALQMFPFFLMGQLLDTSRLMKAVPPPSTLTMASTWLLLFSLLYLENHSSIWSNLTDDLFHLLDSYPAPFMTYRYPASCDSAYYWLWARYGASLAYRTFCMFIFLLFGVPRGRVWFTDAGSATMYAYLLHMPLVRYTAMGLTKADALYAATLANLPPALDYICFIALATALNLWFAMIVYVLTLHPVRSMFGVLIEPTWLLNLATAKTRSPEKAEEAK